MSSMPSGNMLPQRPMKSLEHLRDVFAAQVGVEHLVELAHHLANRRQVFRRHVLQRLLHALEHVAEHLLAQLLHEVVEGLARVRVHELVVHELAHHAARVVRQRVEGLLLAVRDLLQHVLHLLRDVLLLRRLVEALLDALALLLDDVAQLLADVVHGRVHVVALELLLAALA